MAENQLATWYNSIPEFTRYWFTAAVVGPMSARLGLVDIWSMLLGDGQHTPWQCLWNNFHIWRPLTALVAAKPSFGYLMLLYFLYQYSTRLEEGDFAGKRADMAFMMLTIFSTSIVMGYLLGMLSLFKIPIMAAIYIWCNLNKGVVVPFYFGVRVPAQYLPWVLCIFNMIVNGSGFDDLVGIFVGHVYYFFKFRYAQDFGGPDLLRTPQWVQNLFPSRGRPTGGFGAPPTRPEPRTGGGGGGGGFSAFSGQGRRLGD